MVASGSIQAAAGHLGYTPSAVSQHVATLQRETGLTLVSRVGRGIEPTAAGRALAAEIDDVLVRLGDVEALVGDLRAGRTGTLSLSYFASVGSAWMPSVVATLLAGFPDLRLDLALQEEVASGLSDRPDVQIAVARPEAQASSAISVHHLLDDPYVVALRRDDELADRTSVELAELSSRRWVDNDFARGWCRRNLIDACHAAGFSPTFHVEAHDYPTALAFVAAGIGPTVLPRLGVLQLPPAVVAVPLTHPTPVRSIQALVQTSVVSSPPVQATLAALRAVAAG